MITLTEKKLVAYTSAITAILLNILKLFSLRPGEILPKYSSFNIYEYLFQFVWNFLFCCAIGLITVLIEKKKFTSIYKKTFSFLLLYLAALLAAQLVGVSVQKQIFIDTTPEKIFRALYFIRLFISLVLEAVLIRLFWLLQERKSKMEENEQLRNAYLTAQLELLKQQLNPHFFFNTLSSLSAIVREDAKKAQRYILDLSKIFRYTLEQKEKSLVTVEEELSVLNSYIDLMKMRFEENLKVDINIENECLKYKLPHMSLQPLLENAVKHNSISNMQPLLVKINCVENNIEFCNNIHPLKLTEPASGIGLSNLNERFKILAGKEINIVKDDACFKVILPLT